MKFLISPQPGLHPKHAVYIPFDKIEGFLIDSSENFYGKAYCVWINKEMFGKYKYLEDATNAIAYIMGVCNQVDGYEIPADGIVYFPRDEERS